ncbi:c-type cytochrome [Chelativorans xinjiangense]|uniref:c-type cytochrome n=1 Tax=Chelativorans xinjiangense TaxID=2681485 RepID=UPI00135CE7B8|nr:c-type cytochrome [Chelativorans xinjiangense]
MSGVYNVSASIPHFAVTDAILRLALRRSVATHAAGVETPDLTDEGLAELGSRHFTLGCAPCHGTANAEPNPVARAMYPPPPALHHAAEDWSTEELYWIIANGLKFTGMPAWSGVGRDDEVWALVAFLSRLSETNANDGRPVTWRETPSDAGSALRFLVPERNSVDFCAGCHGDAGAKPVDGLVPSLNGQRRAYLERALVEYGRNQRQSGMMEPIARALDEDERQALARRFSDKLRAPPENGDKQQIARGRAIAKAGAARAQIPPCLACHSERSSDRFPRLDSLSSDYIARQLALMRDGRRMGTTYGRIMTTIARRLSQADIDAVAAYFASKRETPVDTASHPADATGAP